MPEDPFAQYSEVVEEYLREYPGMTTSTARRWMEHDIARVIHKELKNAVGDEGLTPKHLEDNAPITLDLLRIPDGQAACEIIRGILDIMAAKNAKNTAEVRNAFGGEGYPKTLKERRQAMAPISGVTVAGVRQREYVGLEHLATEIVELVKARCERPLGQNVVNAINGFRLAVQEQTALLRQIHNL